jgi:cell wall-associated NlpC family hydrolase
MFKLKPLLAAVTGLILSIASASAAPPSSDSTQPNPDTPPANHADDKNSVVLDLAAVSAAASKIGDVISAGVQAFGSDMHQVTDQTASLIEHAKQALGARYRWGGSSIKTGFDCSGFVRAVVQQTIGKLLPHQAASQAATTQTIRKDQLQPGDLVFFNTLRRRAYSHVGIYMGDNQFIHAPSRGQRVRIDSLSATYWQKHFEGARRVLTGEPSSGRSIFSIADAPELNDGTPAINPPPTSIPSAIGTASPAAMTATPQPGDDQPTRPQAFQP